jgi:hypothetical protein
VLRLNVGCGDDYRDGFVNIDGSEILKKVDLIVKIPDEKISSHFEESSVRYILCKDFLEHHYHFQAVNILEDFYKVMEIGGELEIRIPDAHYIIVNPCFSVERKLTLLFGGQDVPQGNAEMDESRKAHPCYFCHKYGWTKTRIRNELESIGMKVISIKRIGSNLVARASK